AVDGAVTAICLGLAADVVENVFGAVPVAHEDTHAPMLAALIGLTTAIVGGILLFPRFGHVGVAAAIAISGWVGASVLNFILRRRGWLSLDAEARLRLPAIILASIGIATPR